MYSTCGVKANMTLVWMLYSWLVPITPTGYGGLEGRGGEEWEVKGERERKGRERQGGGERREGRGSMSGKGKREEGGEMREGRGGGGRGGRKRRGEEGEREGGEKRGVGGVGGKRGEEERFMIRIQSMYAHCSEQCTAYLPESFIFLFTPSMYKYGHEGNTHSNTDSKKQYSKFGHSLKHLCKIPTVLMSVPSVVPGSSHVMGPCNGMYTALLILVVQNSLFRILSHLLATSADSDCIYQLVPTVCVQLASFPYCL